MKIHSNAVFGALLLAIGVMYGEQAQAASINAVGSQLGLTAFRTTNVAKTLDADGDNVYGTDGYLLFNVNEGGNELALFDNTAQSNPAYVTGFAAGSGGPGSPERNSSGNSSFLMVDNPALSPSTSVADIRAGGGFLKILPLGDQNGVEYELLQITLQDALPSGGFRLGVLADTVAAKNSPASIRLSGAGGDSGSVTLTANNNTDADWYFFDVLGAADGDVLSLFLTRNSIGTAASQGISGLVFDTLPVAPVPEPSTFVLFALGLLAPLSRRRARRSSAETVC